ncbi:hypothetical protein ACLOJK_025117 [Asimina triloba]
MCWGDVQNGMIRSEIERLVSRQRAARDCFVKIVIMALNRDLFCVGTRGFSRVADGRCQNQAKCFIGDIGCGSRPGPGNGLIIRGCFDHRGGACTKADDWLQKARAMPPHPQLVRDLGIGIQASIGSKSMNAQVAHEHGSTLGFDVSIGPKSVDGQAAHEHGSPLGFPDRSVLQKLVVAVDVDEVLGSFLSALNKFISNHYNSNHSVSEYYVYEFFKIWKCSRSEADIRVHEFFKTAYFKKGIHPIPGAHDALLRLSTFCSLSVVTSRQNAIKDHTIEWLNKHYPGLFDEIHFGNHFALDGKSKPKSEICRSLGAQVLIDDNPRYAAECAEVGIRVLLFDYHNSYPWCKSGSIDLHPLVTKVHNWEEVEREEMPRQKKYKHLRDEAGGLSYGALVIIHDSVKKLGIQNEVGAAGSNLKLQCLKTVES